MTQEISKLKFNESGNVYNIKDAVARESLKAATVETAGLVKPDGTSITIDGNGVISCPQIGDISTALDTINGEVV